MRAGAYSRRTIAIFSRIGPNQSDKFLHGLGRDRRIDGKHLHCGRPDGYRLEVLHGIVGDLVVEIRICREANSINEKDSVAVRCPWAARPAPMLPPAPGTFST